MAGSQVVAFFVQETKIIVACKNMIYVRSDVSYESSTKLFSANREKLNENSLPSDDTEDLFESSVEFGLEDTLTEHGALLHEPSILQSDVKKHTNIVPVYKYKHCALAFHLQGDNLYSLHIKNLPFTTDQNKTTQVPLDVFYLECCCVTDFTCISTCISSFELPRNERSGAYWIQMYPASTLKREFIDKYFDRNSILFQNSIDALLLFVFCGKESVQILVIQENKNIKKVHVQEMVSVNLGLNHPIDIYKIRKEVERSDNTNFFEISELIEEILSNQLADAGKLTLTFSPLSINQIFNKDWMGRHCILVLFVDGRLAHYRKIGKEVCKWKVPLTSIVTCAFGVNNDFYALSSSGILYKCSEFQLNMNENKVSPKCHLNDVVQSLLDVADTMEEVNLQKISQQEITQQLKIFSSIINMPNYLKGLSFDTNIEIHCSTGSKLRHRLLLTIGHIDDITFLGQFWKILVTIEISRECNVERSFLQHVIKFPMEHKHGLAWTAYIDIPGDIDLSSFPLILNIELLLDVPTQTGKSQLKTNVVHQRKITSLDFVSLNAVLSSNRNEPSEHIFKLTKSMVTEEEDLGTFENFLSRINKSRPVHSIFQPDMAQELQNEQNTSAAISTFSFELDRNILARLSKQNHFFAELERSIENCSKQTRQTSHVMTFSLLGEALFLTMQITNQVKGRQSVFLELNGQNTTILNNLKSDIFNCLKSDMEFETKEIKDVIVSYELCKKIENMKKQVELLDINENPENIATYRKLYHDLRKTLNAVMFSLYKND